MLKRQLATDPPALRSLFVLVQDTEALAAFDRQAMNQDTTVEVRSRP